MKLQLIVLACMTGLLSACSSATLRQDTPQAASGNVRGTSGSIWNGGVWNSVMGYHGPSNTMGEPGGPN